ncbi:sulfurtransferase [Agromyces intestinalis]|uniref:thiosulfate sulfurtransferase n=1 Tax=Agromyces intestinalis TaxID=2592652 RepID=A0A5C1YIA2_9MICO|nr:sulfurtransferase [Agromyces intestinalis]QEO14839.1 sulfurtransferase [Agromyces intestinalis]
MSRERDVITAEQLLARFEAGEPPILLDIRFSPRGPDLRPQYEAGHIPGARFVDLAGQLAGEGGGTAGRRPLPDPADLQETLRSLGIDDDSEVVVYDDNSGLSAGRGWWVLTWAGLEHVRLLDGGYAAWLAAGGGVSAEEPPPATRGTVSVRPGALPVLDADGAAGLPDEGVLLDARGESAYLGGPREPGAAPTGHIPGALEAGTRANLDERGLLRPEPELRERFASLGVAAGTKVGAYCGGGVAAAHEVLVLRTLGIEASLFVGSWSAWSADPSRPVATGSRP